MLKYIDDKEPSLEDLQEYVGGYIETVTLLNGDTLVINEDGLNLDLKVNQEATKVYLDNGGMRSNKIRGNAVIVKKGLLK